MEYELKDAGPSRKELLLKFSPEDVKEAFGKSYDDINSYVRIKGFRQGKAPRRVLENRFAKEAASGVQEKLLQDNVKKIIEETKIQPFGAYEVKNQSAMPEDGKEYALDMLFDIIPEFELPEYKGIEIKEEEVTVEDDKVDAALDRYRRMFADYKVVDEPAQKEDVLEVNFVAKHGDEEIMSMSDQRLRVEGDILFGLPCPDLEEKFTGAKKGDEITLTITLPEDHPNAELRGKDAAINVTVLTVNRGELPEVNDAFAEGLGMGTLEQFRERIKNNLIREAYVETRQREENEIIDGLIAKVTFDVPEAAVRNETLSLMDGQRQRLIRAGAQPGAAMDEQIAKYRPEAEKEAERKIRWTFIVNKIAEKEGIQVTNDDLAQQVEALAQNYRTTPAKIMQRIREFDGVEPMVAEILAIKVMNFIVLNRAGGAKSDSAEFNQAAAESATAVTGEGETGESGQEQASTVDNEE
ncbi:MAG: trigger factor [Planctomycetaceae bacterium]|nr:trigger factor [Planctomycetaceae bacterium]